MTVFDGATTEKAYTAGEWHHLAVCFSLISSDNTSQVDFYSNTISISTLEVPTVILDNVRNHHSIGGALVNQDTYETFINAFIYKYCYYNSCRASFDANKAPGCGENQCTICPTVPSDPYCLTDCEWNEFFDEVSATCVD